MHGLRTSRRGSGAIPRSCISWRIGSEAYGDSAARKAVELKEVISDPGNGVVPLDVRGGGTAEPRAKLSVLNQGRQSRRQTLWIVGRTPNARIVRSDGLLWTAEGDQRRNAAGHRLQHRDRSRPLWDCKREHVERVQEAPGFPLIAGEVHDVRDAKRVSKCFQFGAERAIADQEKVAIWR